MEKENIKSYFQKDCEIIVQRDVDGRMDYYEKHGEAKISYHKEDLRDLIDGFFGRIQSLVDALNAEGQFDPSFLLETLFTHTTLELNEMWDIVHDQIGEISIDQADGFKSNCRFGRALRATLKTTSNNIKEMLLTADYHRDSDILADFIAEIWPIQERGRVKADDLWDLYGKWHLANVGNSPMHRTSFDSLLKISGIIENPIQSKPCV